MSPVRAALLTGFALAGLFAADAGVANAVAPPGSAQLARLQVACDAAWRVRVTTTNGIFQRRGAIVEAGGITIPRPPGRPALFIVGDPQAPERTLRWSEIEAVGTEQPRVLRGALMGFVAGAALSGALLGVVGPRAHDASPVVVWAAGIVTLGFTALGLVVGAGSPEIHPLYP